MGVEGSRAGGRYLTGRIEGDRLAELYGRHAPGALRFAYLLTGDKAFAEDLVQDAFVKLAGRLAPTRDPRSFDFYLRKMVLNLIRSAARRRRTEHAYLRREAHGQQEDQIPDLAERDLFRRALLKLPERQRAAIVLRHFEDLSEAQMADILECRPGTVKSLLSRGMASLKTQIERGEQ